MTPEIPDFITDRMEPEPMSGCWLWIGNHNSYGYGRLGQRKAHNVVEMWGNAKTFKNVYGVLITDGEPLKALEKAVIRPGDDCTGAMHQCVMGHLAFIHKNGIDKWHSELAGHRAPEKQYEYEWDGK